MNDTIKFLDLQKVNALHKKEIDEAVARVDRKSTRLKLQSR